MTSWFRDPELAESERVLFRRAATMRQKRRSVGGEVSVTDRRLLFTPNTLEHYTGGRAFAVPLAMVGESNVIPPGRGAVRRAGIGGILRPQLMIDTPDRTVVLTLPEPAALVAALHRAGGAA